MTEGPECHVQTFRADTVAGAVIRAAYPCVQGEEAAELHRKAVQKLVNQLVDKDMSVFGQVFVLPGKAARFLAAAHTSSIERGASAFDRATYAPSPLPK